MNLLIDTHTFLWFINDDPQLSTAAATLLESEHTILLSTVSIWEIALKISIGKLTLAQPFEQFIPEQLALNDITLLPIRITDCSRVVNLPFHHRDPFDRMLIAQASVDQMPIVSIDAAFDAYGVQRLW